ncbi:MAG TPA: phosphate/phosphite/phosphonate ABC transporter substrate-binding protein [Acidimicrobiia bacterium]|nr:phosphate/phosphite/phosphonate ABC transporter substrate-binding protein [Acidimicrobiia bacterium]
MNKRALWACLVLVALVAAACGGGDGDTTTTAGAEEPTTTAAPAEDTTTSVAAEVELGSPERPVKVLFVPSVDAQVIVSGGEIMKTALEDATGLSFEVSVPTSYAATIEEMCAAPEDTMGFIPGFGYVLANNLCGVDVAFKAVRFGFGVYWAQILVPRDSDIETVEDLEGLTWAIPDLGSTSGYLVPLVMLEEAGVTPGETVETGGHPNAALAVYRGDAEFGTTFYSPPLIADGQWEIGDPPEVPDEYIDSCAVDAEGDLYCGPNQEYRVLDARASATTDAPDIVQEVRILAISPEIPNDTLSFGPDFPAELRTQIEEALVAFAAECEDDENCAWNDSIGNQDFYGWTGIEPATDAEYDALRAVVETAGIELEDL